MRIDKEAPTDPFDRVFAEGTGRVGSFKFYPSAGRWEWSAAVARMHGYEPEAVTPTTELMLAHKHPDDKGSVAAMIDRTRRSGEPFSSRHRIIDTRGAVHHVVVVGDRMVEDGVVGTAGFYIDITESLEFDVQESVTEAVDAISNARAVIDQAKGMIMLVHGISADRAFDVLAWRSQEANIKLRAIAEQLVLDVAAGVETPHTFRDTFDHLLLTTHERVPKTADQQLG